MPPSQKVLKWEKRNRVTFDDSPNPPLRVLKKEQGMVRCFDCCNLIKSWRPTAKSDWLFEEKWKCKSTGEVFEKYYLIKTERECPFYEKRPRLLIQLEDLEA